MNKLKNFLSFIILFFIILIIFKYNYTFSDIVISSVNLWLKKVFPFLFIMIILNNIIIESHILDGFVKLISPLFNKIFHTSNLSSEAFILSLFSGTPSSAFIIKELYEKKLISLLDANKLLSFTYFANPLFLYNILNLTFNKNITIKIVIIHYISNIIVGILLRGKKEKNTLKEINNESSKNIFLLIPSSINKAINILLVVLGTITFFMIVTNILFNIINVPDCFQIIIKGFFEITQSLNILNSLKYPLILKEIIAISIISFGGLSIHFQVLSIINDTKLKYKNFLYGRILQTVLSILLITCSIFFRIFIF